MTMNDQPQGRPTVTLCELCCERPASIIAVDGPDEHRGAVVCDECTIPVLGLTWEKLTCVTYGPLTTAAGRELARELMINVGMSSLEAGRRVWLVRHAFAGVGVMGDERFAHLLTVMRGTIA